MRHRTVRLNNKVIRVEVKEPREHSYRWYKKWIMKRTKQLCPMDRYTFDNPITSLEIPLPKTILYTNVDFSITK